MVPVQHGRTVLAAAATAAPHELGPTDCTFHVAPEFYVVRSEAGAKFGASAGAKSFQFASYAGVPLYIDVVTLFSLWVLKIVLRPKIRD